MTDRDEFDKIDAMLDEQKLAAPLCDDERIRLLAEKLDNHTTLIEVLEGKVLAMAGAVTSLRKVEQAARVMCNALNVRLRGGHQLPMHDPFTVDDFAILRQALRELDGAP